MPFTRQSACLIGEILPARDIVRRLIMQATEALELELPGITTRMRPLVAPLVFYTLAFRPAAHNAAVRGYSLECRRYM